ncbi:DUF2190 family protein [Ancylobacter polymorphus]|uniref:RecA/RadA family phage recombinase n=1 Tax=Ancylobacter polymorphus TaxID=223390 RepID=A0ABU0B628_9HYPH|nr:DUF2190 family protein [Ancylobacter polymorphus]MDQ0301278.1 putative RecA/RadA family phage recombinase [Ancylobacter polymorphus]
MKNFRHHGNNIPVPAPAGGVLSGEGVVVGSLFGIASGDAAEGATVNIALIGTFELKKTSAQAWTIGAKVYWDAANKVATTTASGNSLIGVAVEQAANPSATGLVRLNGSF